MRNCPIALEGILGVTQLHIHTKSEAERTALRYACLRDIKNLRGYMEITNEIPNREFRVSNSDMRLKNRDFDNTLIWFTNSSKINQGTGCGLYGTNTGLSLILGKHATIF